MADSDILSKGFELYNAKKYSDAFAFFLSLPESPDLDAQEIAYYLGLCCTKLKKYEDALLYLEQVVTGGKHLERVLQCRFILAVLYTKSGRKRLASFELNKLLESGYKPASVYASMAFIAWEQQEADVAISYYEKSLEIEENNITSLNGLGYVLAVENKDLTKALSCCKKAVQLSPDSAACLDSLGFVYYKLGLLNDAKKYLEMAEQFDKENEIIADHIRDVRLAGA